MNYRHTYHAGNFADVHKHAALSLLLQSLLRKPSPFLYLDTHAGTGYYQLESVEAEKTGEWRCGIGKIPRMEESVPILDAYWQTVQKLNVGGELTRYPGSPAVAAAMLRPQDRLVLCELHPQDAETLRRRFLPDKRAGVHFMDGYSALKAMLPPPERRGLVLIDPPYEVPDEMARLCRGLKQALKKWPNGIYCLWYPIKNRPAIEAFHGELTMLGLPKTLVADLWIRGDSDPTRLNGSGMAIINPPWQLDQSLAELHRTLLPLLGEADGHANVDWLVPEQGA